MVDDYLKSVDDDLRTVDNDVDESHDAVLEYLIIVMSGLIFSATIIHCSCIVLQYHKEGYQNIQREGGSLFFWGGGPFAAL